MKTPTTSKPETAAPSSVQPDGYAFRCKCGSVVFTRSAQVRGTWETIIEFTADGEVKTEGCGDSVRAIRQSKTMRCDGCRKRVKVPELDALA